MRPRNSDGTLRRANKPKLITARTLTARWIEAETLHLKQLGMSFAAIAEHVTRVAAGQEKALIEIPTEVEFSAGYCISAQAIHRAFKRAIERLPRTEAEAFRKLDTERCEAMILALQSGIRKGDPKSADVAVRILEYKAKINGYLAPSKHEVSGGAGTPIPIGLFQEAIDALDKKD